MHIPSLHEKKGVSGQFGIVNFSDRKQQQMVFILAHKREVSMVPQKFRKKSLMALKSLSKLDF